MGFLDKLFGRGKEAAQDVGEVAEKYGDKAVDTAKDVGDKAKETYGDVKEKVTGEGESATTQAEEGLDQARDEAAKNEGRIP